jgi:5-hydroxyisourate hydrolase
MTGKLTTHVLDTAHGCPAANLTIELWAIESPSQKTHLKTLVTNADGRTDTPFLTDAEFKVGRYELVFVVGEYFAKKSTQKGAELPEVPFLDRVPIQFGVANSTVHYHVPLLASPWSYSTYRGS